jgi:hypothetical protein
MFIDQICYCVYKYATMFLYVTETTYKIVTVSKCMQLA